MDKTVRFDVVSNLTVYLIVEKNKIYLTFCKLRITITTNKKKKGENEICEKVNF